MPQFTKKKNICWKKTPSKKFLEKGKNKYKEAPENEGIKEE